MNLENSKKMILWNKISLFLKKQLPKEEAAKFVQRMKEDPELAEMVAFAKALDIQDNEEMLTDAQLQNVTENGPPHEMVNHELNFLQDIAFTTENEALITADNFFRGLPKPDVPKPKLSWLEQLQDFFYALSTPKAILYFLLPTLITASAFVAYQFFNKGQENNFAFFDSVSDFEYVIEEESEARQAYEGTTQGKDYDRAARVLEMFSANLEETEPENTPTKSYYDLYLAICKIRQDKFEEAQLLLESLVDQDVNLFGEPEHLFLGLIYYGNGDYDDARVQLQIAQENKLGKLEDGTPIATVASNYLKRIEEQ